MVHAILHRHVGDVVWIDAFQAPDVVAELVRIGTPLVVGVDAAVAAEIVPGDAGVELVQPHHVLPANHPQAIKRYRGDHRALAPADRAIAAARIDHAIGQLQFELDRAAMTGGAVDRPDRGAANLLQHRVSATGAIVLAITAEYMALSTLFRFMPLLGGSLWLVAVFQVLLLVLGAFLVLRIQLLGIGTHGILLAG